MRNFGEIRQLGYVVPDLDKAIAYWTDRMNIGAVFVTHDIRFPDYYYRGELMESPCV